MQGSCLCGNVGRRIGSNETSIMFIMFQLHPRQLITNNNSHHQHAYTIYTFAIISMKRWTVDCQSLWWFGMPQNNFSLFKRFFPTSNAWPCDLFRIISPNRLNSIQFPINEWIAWFIEIHFPWGVLFLSNDFWWENCVFLKHPRVQ